MAWSTPIIDRTLADAVYAKANQNEVADLKGAWNISDANRIIDNTIYLKDLLIANGYPCTITSQAYFVQSNLPFITSKIKVMKDNINAVVNAFYKQDNPTILYGDTLSFTGANNMEINLKITNDLLQAMILELLYCGVPISGEDVIL